MNTKVRQALDIIKTMSAWEYSQTTSALEKEFDIVAKAPEPIFIEPVVEEIEKVEFNVIMVDFIPTKKIRVIKEVRSLLGLGLKDTKNVVEAKNLTVGENVSKEKAEQLKAKFEELGCTIVVK